MTRPNFLTTKVLQLLLLTILLGIMTTLLAGLIPLTRLLPGPEARAAGTIDVTTTADEYDTSGSGNGCSLREAIESINTSSSFGGCNNPGNAADTIQLQANTYILSIPGGPAGNSNPVGDLDVQESMTIRGAGSTQTVISTTTLFNDRVFNLSSGGNNFNATITIEAMTIQGGKIYSGGGGGVGIYVFGPNSLLTLSDVVIENNLGGGIFHEAGVLNLYNVTIRNNQATGWNGGGLYVTSGKIILTNVTLSGNQADLGGAIYIYDYAHGFATNGGAPQKLYC